MRRANLLASNAAIAPHFLCIAKDRLAVFRRWPLLSRIASGNFLKSNWFVRTFRGAL